MFILDHEDQIRADARRARHLELAADCQYELQHASRMPGGVRADALEPENRAMFLGQTDLHQDSTRPDYRLRHPNEYAIHSLVEHFCNDSAYASHWRADAGESRLFEQMLRHVVSALVPTLYIPNQARSIFPIDTSLPAGAETILKQRVIDEDDDAYGQISPNGDDIQIVEISAESDIYRMASFARGIYWNLDELESAAFAGVPLQSEKMAALNRAVERIFELVAYQGYAPANITGTYNDANIAITAVVTGTWATATADQIVGDIDALVEANVTANGANYRPNRLVVPQSLTRYMKVRRANTDLTVREMVQANEPQMQIVECNRANLYDAAGTGPRLMAYVADPMFLNVGVARNFTLEPAEKHGLRYRLFGRQKLAGCICSVPLTANYMDGC